MTNLKSAAEVKEMFSQVNKAGGDYTRIVQETAVQCIGHAIQHGDVTLATAMLVAIRGHDKAILVAFFEKNGPFRYQKADGAFEKNRAWVGTFQPELIPNWEKAKRISEPKSVYDVDEAFDQFIKRVHSQIKTAKSTKNVELVAVLEHAQAVYNAKRILAESEAAIAKLAEERAAEPVLPAVKAA